MSPLAPLLADFAARRALRAGSFIVTLYGDVAAPRGGELAMAGVVAACGLVGLSETLARTAVSRLVEAGTLAGARVGRRSFYRLTPAASAEFAAAAARIHGPGEAAPAAPWTLAALPEPRGPLAEALLRRGFGLRGGFALRPGDARAELRAAAPGAVAFLAPPEAEPAALAALAAEGWDLAALGADYAAFAARFAALDPWALSPPQALAARLLLVHDFRRIALRDPALPAAALPPGWPGQGARARFRALYAALSPAAERFAAGPAAARPADDAA